MSIEKAKQHLENLLTEAGVIVGMNNAIQKENIIRGAKQALAELKLPPEMNVQSLTIDIQELYETLDWMLIDMKCRYRWEKNIPEHLEDCEVDYSPELTKAIGLHKQLKSFLGEKKL